jgi:hypothetical protein
MTLKNENISNLSALLAVLLVIVVLLIGRIGIWVPTTDREMWLLIGIEWFFLITGLITLPNDTEDSGLLGLASMLGFVITAVTILVFLI